MDGLNNRGPIDPVPDLERDRRFAAETARIWREWQGWSTAPSKEAIFRECLDDARRNYGKAWVEKGFRSERMPT